MEDQKLNDSKCFSAKVTNGFASVIFCGITLGVNIASNHLSGSDCGYVAFLWLSDTHRKELTQKKYDKLIRSKEPLIHLIVNLIIKKYDLGIMTESVSEKSVSDFFIKMEEKYMKMMLPFFSDYSCVAWFKECV